MSQQGALELTFKKMRPPPSAPRSTRSRVDGTENREDVAHLSAADGACSCSAADPQGLTPLVAPCPKRGTVSFQSRQKKRRYKRAVEKSRRDPETARRWFLTLARKDCVCASCGDQLKRNAEIVYRHTPREIRCQRCALACDESKGFHPSVRWERARRNERRAA